MRPISDSLRDETIKKLNPLKREKAALLMLNLSWIETRSFRHHYEGQFQDEADEKTFS